MTPAPRSGAGGSAGPRDPVLEVEDLTVGFSTARGGMIAVNRLSWSVGAGETLCIVGESGCGKSVTALSVLRLVPQPPAKILGGAIRFDGMDLTRVGRRAMRRIRGNRISMIFQEPMSSLNPLLPVGRQISEQLRIHRGCGRAEARARALEMMRLVRIPDPARWLDDYPHRMSGGMRQRVMIAMALICDPAVLLADEPTTALDVTIQAQILRLIQELRARFGTSVVLITHDLGVVAEMADRVLVMYAGHKVEEAPAAALFERPLHPYTQGLMASVPRMDQAGEPDGAARLREIPGTVPTFANPPPGCVFADRCDHVRDRCRRQPPPVEEKAPGHFAACWRSHEIERSA